MLFSVKLIKFILYFIVVLLIERDLHKIFRNMMLSHDYHIFRVNSKKKFSPYSILAKLLFLYLFF